MATPKCGLTSPDGTRKCIQRQTHIDCTDGVESWPNAAEVERLARGPMTSVIDRRTPWQKKQAIKASVRGMKPEPRAGSIQLPARQQARTRRTDPSTSHIAAGSVTDLRASQLAVLGLFRDFGPMSDEMLIECAKQNGVRQSTSGLRTRRAELVDFGYLEDSGDRTETVNARPTIIWRVRG